MEPGEGSGKTLRGVVAVLHGDVDDLFVRLLQRAGGQRQTPHTDVVPQCKAAEHPKHSLEMKG